MTQPRQTTNEEGVLPGKGGSLYFRTLRISEPWARLAVLHGYGDHAGRYAELMAWLAERGVEPSVFDFRGHGRSAGRRGAVLQWSEYLEDLDVFLAHVEEHGRRDVPLFVLGHSHGGLVAVAAALRGLPQVAGIVLSAPYLRRRVHVPLYKDLAARMLSRFFPAFTLPTGLPRNAMTADDAMIRESESDTLLLRTASARWYITAHRAQAEVVTRAAELYAPLLVLTGDADPIADPRGAHDLFAQAGSASKQFRIYPGFLHEILRERGREAVYTHIYNWLREQSALLCPEPNPAPDSSPSPE